MRARGLVLESILGLDLLSRPSPAYRDRVASVGADIRPDLVDQLIELYCDWRTACAEVWAAYERFRDAPPSDRAMAFAVYAVALDQEESACGAYAAQIRLIQARCTIFTGRSRRREATRRYHGQSPADSKCDEM